VVGLIFPPALLASAAVGAGIGAGTGKVVDRVSKRKVKEDVEWWWNPASQASWCSSTPESTAEVEKGLGKASRIVREHIDEDDDDTKAKNADIYE
jgi:hypothetical protein